jgi:hypothetical protein
MLTAPPTLTITDCKFENYLYEMDSFIMLNQFGGYISITGTEFNYFSFCGAFIANRDVHLYERSDLSFGDLVENYMRRANNYQK